MIGPFSYTLHGDTVSLPAVEIKVLVPGAGDSASPAQRMSDLLFATLSIDQPHVYVQQSFAMVLSIFSQGLNLDREVQLTDFKTAGLKIEGYDEMGATREVVNGQPYDVRRFRVRATALTAGTFSLSPGFASTPWCRPSGGATRSRASSAMRSSPGPRCSPSMWRRNPSIPTVKDLPVEGSPRELFRRGRALLLRRGGATAAAAGRRSGNPHAHHPRPGQSRRHHSSPALALGDAFKVYEPRLVTDDPANGQRVFEQVVIPRTAKATDLPAISFSFFDPQMEAYQTISHGPYTLALDATGATDPMMLQGAGHPAISVPASLGSDIVYLKSAPRRWARHTDRSWYESPVVWSLQGVAPAALAMIFLVARRRDALASDTARARRHHAPRSARLAMAEAEQKRVAGSRQEFFEGLWKVLTTYFGHRFNLAPGEVAVEEVSRRLQRAGGCPCRNSWRFVNCSRTAKATGSARVRPLLPPFPNPSARIGSCDSTGSVSYCDTASGYGYEAMDPTGGCSGLPPGQRHGAVADPLPPERVFAQAAQAYDEERFADAQILYEQLKAQGYVTPEIYFNLGNTLIRQGQLGLGNPRVTDGLMC